MSTRLSVLQVSRQREQLHRCGWLPLATRSVPYFGYNGSVDQYAETDPLQIGGPSDEIVLLDVIAYEPTHNLRVGDQVWASGTGVAEGVDAGFFAYHNGGSEAGEPEVRQKRKYTRRVPIGLTAQSMHSAAAKGQI